MSRAEFLPLLRLQTDSGAFPSTVETGAGEVTDETCFVTASVTLILQDLARAAPGEPGLLAAISHALGFIESCEDPARPGAFHFYAQCSGARCFVEGLPADADDTALAWLVLMRAGMRSPAEAARVLPSLLDAAAVTARRRGDAPWMRRGLWRTWLDADLPENPADLCVNANILACLAAAGLGAGRPCRRAADVIATVCRNHVPTRLAMRGLAPYYAHPAEIDIALRRAIRLGVPALLPARNALAPYFLDRDDAAQGRPARRPLYCNSHGRPVWRAPALQLARQIFDQMISRNRRLAPSGT